MMLVHVTTVADSLIFIENGDCLDCKKMHGDAANCSGHPDQAPSGSPSPSKVLLDGSTYLPIASSPGLAATHNAAARPLRPERRRGESPPSAVR